MDRRSDYCTAQYVDTVLSILRDDEDCGGVVSVLLEFGLPMTTVLRIAASTKNRRELPPAGETISRQSRIQVSSAA